MIFKLIKIFIAIVFWQFVFTNCLAQNFAMPSSYMQRGILKIGDKEQVVSVFAKSDGLNNVVQIDSDIGKLCSIKTLGKTIKSADVSPYVFKKAWVENFVANDIFYILNVFPKCFEDIDESKLDSLLKEGFSIYPKNDFSYQIKFLSFKKIASKYAAKEIEIIHSKYSLKLRLINSF